MSITTLKMRPLQTAAILLLAGACRGQGTEHTIMISPAHCNGVPCGNPLQWAQAAARKLASQSSNQPATVIRMSPGEYALTRPLELGTADSSVRWIGPANVSGFIEVTDWTLNVSTGVWTAPLPAPFSPSRLPTQLFVNGDRRVRARMPAVVGGDARNVSAAYSAASSFDRALHWRSLSSNRLYRIRLQCVRFAPRRQSPSPWG